MINLVNHDYSFLRFNANAKTIELISSETDEVGIYEDSYLKFSMGSL